MNIVERFLLFLSRKPEDPDYSSTKNELKIDNALSLLLNVYPDFEKIITGKRIVDFGCGIGLQSIALAVKYNCQVLGLDTSKKTLQKAIELAVAHKIPNQKLSFKSSISKGMKGKYDIVFSQNSFEHFNDPIMILNEMKELITESGRLLITFGPPWLAPYGSHMHFFCKMPWINVIFSEETVMKVRSRFRDDGATRYEGVESGLNRMTVKKFEETLSVSGLKVEFQKYSCVRGMNFFVKVPILREFFINRVSVILSKAI